MPAQRVSVSIEHTGDRQGRAIQAQTQKIAQQANRRVIPADAVIVTGFTFGSGTATLVQHGLGRVPAGWMMVAPRNFVSGVIAFTQVISAGDPDLKFVLVLHGQGVFDADVMVW